MNYYDENAPDFPPCTYPCRGCGEQTRAMSADSWTCRNCGAGGQVSFPLTLGLICGKVMT